MFSRDRLYQLAVIGFLIGLILLMGGVAISADESQKPAVKTEQGKDTTGNKGDTSPPFVPPEKQEAPALDKQPDDKANYYSEADLEAQRRMAVAAEQLTNFTDTQITINAAEVILILIAIGVACWAAVEAGRAAKATAETVKITKDTAETQLRAYVATGEIGCMTFKEGNTETINTFSVTIPWQNYGATPARRCRSWISSDSFENYIPKDFDYPDGSSVIPQTEKSHIGPKGVVRATVVFTADQVQAAQRGETKLFVWCWIEYDDIFKKTPRRRTEVCFQAALSPDGSTFTATLAGPFNGADEDCHQQPKT